MQTKKKVSVRSGKGRKLRVLIYRLGSLGDAIVALPSMHLVQRVFPDSERWILTNYSVTAKAAPMAQILTGTDLVEDYIEYPLGVRGLGELRQLRSKIRSWKPDILIYLTEPRGRLNAWRDAAFFRACGIPKLIGVPYSKGCQYSRKEGDRYEYEGTRLARCLKALGETDFDAHDAFDLHLNDQERSVAQHCLSQTDPGQPLIVASIGAKVDVKDWGDANWSQLFEKLAKKYPDAALVMVGAQVEYQRSQSLLDYWAGEKKNLCGQLSVRESAAVIECATLFVGHDSGPMHLAAAVGTRCVAIFSSRNLPGEWFPYGDRHRVIYQSMPCQGCRKDICPEYDKACIRSISVDYVLKQVSECLG